MLKVYGMRASGNCYKVGLALEQLDQAYSWQETDILKGESRTREFLTMNPNGSVPVLEIAAGDYLAESNAILCYLAEGSPLLPPGRRERARVLQWLFFEQYSHEPCIAVARFISVFLAEDHPRRAELPRLRERGTEALAVMDQQLSTRPFIADDYSIADIALYAYTHTATDGGFSLDAYPAVTHWLARVRDQPGHVPQDAVGR